MRSTTLACVYESWVLELPMLSPRWALPFRCLVRHALCGAAWNGNGKGKLVVYCSTSFYNVLALYDSYSSQARNNTNQSHQSNPLLDEQT